MRLYAESSAVLAWLLDEPDGVTVRERLARAEIVVASDLTLIECERVLLRAGALGHVPAARR
ncbi:MAG TPA: type II toxin-antitoxin system VapC family toxin [Vicinamibacterales bacterium]|nr:type II toxin-antitoxin system VapC family toxin [Vicinamibacterales bacterium]